MHVASGISLDERNARRRAGTSWLDLRGHLYLSAPGVLVDTRIRPMVARRPRTDPFGGPAGLDVACALLLEPERPQPVRPLARLLGRSPSTVSEVLAALREVDLVRHDARPVLPNLFWAVAAHWSTPPTWLATMPDPDDVPDWILAGPGAAGLLGAPVDGPDSRPREAVPEFYVPNHGALAHAAAKFGRTTSGQPTAGEAVACVRVAPVRAICERRIEAGSWGDQRWPLAQPLFLALDIAQDEGGRDVLDGWTGSLPGRRVW